MLEFGPRTSTLALLEAGAAVDTCEHDPCRLQEARHGLAHRGVRLHADANLPAISVDALDAADLDLAFVDSPVGASRRRLVQPDEPLRQPAQHGPPGAHRTA